jgi:integrase
MDWTLHDLRRTAASEMARKEVFVEVIEKLQNRSTGKLSGVAGIYNRYDYAEEKREALELWNQTVERCVNK